MASSAITTAPNREFPRDFPPEVTLEVLSFLNLRSFFAFCTSGRLAYSIGADLASRNIAILTNSTQTSPLNFQEQHTALRKFYYLCLKLTDPLIDMDLLPQLPLYVIAFKQKINSIQKRVQKEWSLVHTIMHAWHSTPDKANILKTFPSHEATYDEIRSCFLNQMKDLSPFLPKSIRSPETAHMSSDLLRQLYLASSEKKIDMPYNKILFLVLNPKSPLAHLIDTFPNSPVVTHTQMIDWLYDFGLLHIPSLKVTNVKMRFYKERVFKLEQPTKKRGFDQL